MTLILEPKPDPMLRTHGIERSTTYRLKLALKTLLRSYGLRAVVIRNPTSAESAAVSRETKPADRRISGTRHEPREADEGPP